jgi:hypothetical protein
MSSSPLRRNVVPDSRARTLGLVELVEPLLVGADLGLELLLRQPAGAALAVDVDLRIEHPRQERDGAQVEAVAGHQHRVAPGAEDEDAAQAHRQRRAQLDQRLARGPQVHADRTLALGLEARRRRDALVEQQQAPLVAPPERPRRRDLHLLARVEHVGVDHLLVPQRVLAAVGAGQRGQQRGLVELGPGLEHEVGDQGQGRRRLRRGGHAATVIDTRGAGASPQQPWAFIPSTRTTLVAGELAEVEAVEQATDQLERERDQLA